MPGVWGVKENLELQDKKAQNTQSNLNAWYQQELEKPYHQQCCISRVHAVSHENTDHVEDLSRGNSCYILAKNLIMFRTYPQDVSEAEVKSNGQINLSGRFRREKYSGCGIVTADCFQPGFQTTEQKDGESVVPSDNGTFTALNQEATVTKDT